MKRFEIRSKQDEQSKRLKETLYQRLIELSFIHDEQNPDFVISVGGDGTFLRAIHQYMNQVDTIRFVGIHTGTLGFYTDYQVDELDQFIKDVTSRQFKTMKRYMLEIKINNENSCFEKTNIKYPHYQLKKD